jgi:2-C-methyl-D-erythritol 2,4-cyclodiphosphate synthase
MGGQNMARIGLGFDAHRFAPDRKLILGGVEIPHPLGLAGHSDADVLTHAIIDALLGACALGDIGQHFPDTDPIYKDISSLVLLARTGKLLAQKNYRIINIDTTLILESPKIAPYMTQCRRNIASALEIDIERVSVKATTTEGMGFEGRKEGIAAIAIVSIEQPEK